MVKKIITVNGMNFNEWLLNKIGKKPSEIKDSEAKKYYSTFKDLYEAKKKNNK